LPVRHWAITLKDMPDENPFEPRLEGVPLLFTVDGCSLARLSGEARREASFLLTLTHTPLVDALLLDAPDGLADHLPRGYAAEPDLERDERAIKQVGFERGSLGGVQPWSSRERRADELVATGEERGWFLYYETVTWFHRNSKRHFYVTADPQLLSELEGSCRGGWWDRRRIVTVRSALRLAGWLMRSRNTVYLEAGSNYKLHASNFDLYSHVGNALAPSRVRLHRWLQADTTTESAGQFHDLEQSMHMRVVDLLKARDGVGFQALRRQTNATLDDMLYHLRAAVPTAAALFDSIAVFARLAFGIDTSMVGGPARVSLRIAAFRQALRREGAGQLADLAGACGPLWQMLRALRDPVIHGSGLSGTGFLKIPGVNESRLTLRPDQAQAVLRAAQCVGESAEAWGLQQRSRGEPQVELLLFTHRFSLTLIRTSDRIVRALADDLGAPPLDREASGQEMDRVWKYGLLSGLADELTDAGAPGWTPR
jgi:hypothetical protein